MTVIQLALMLCILDNNIALATPTAQQAACAAQPEQFKAAYLRQAKFILSVQP
jgi:hypothetical protein